MIILKNGTLTEMLDYIPNAMLINTYVKLLKNNRLFLYLPLSLENCIFTNNLKFMMQCLLKADY